MNALIRGILLLVTIGALFVGGASTVLLHELERPVDPSDLQVYAFEVGDGIPIAEIADDLARQGLITSAWLFRWVAAEQQLAAIAPGTYALRRNMTMRQLLATLHPPTDDDVGGAVRLETLHRHGPEP